MTKTIASSLATVVGENLCLLNDVSLEVLLRDVIAEAQRRPAMTPARRALLAGALGEEKAEQLAKTNLSAAEIALATETGSVVSFPAQGGAIETTKGVA
jgi:hypothetical protein